MRFTGKTTSFPTPTERAGFLVGTFELDVIEGTGIYRSIVGGHNHMVDNCTFSLLATVPAASTNSASASSAAHNTSRDQVPQGRPAPAGLPTEVEGAGTRTGPLAVSLSRSCGRACEHVRRHRLLVPRVAPVAGEREGRVRVTHHRAHCRDRNPVLGEPDRARRVAQAVPGEPAFEDVEPCRLLRLLQRPLCVSLLDRATRGGAEPSSSGSVNGLCTSTPRAGGAAPGRAEPRARPRPTSGASECRRGAVSAAR